MMEWEASNAVRLTGRQWAAVGLVAGALFFALPRLWTRAEPLAFDADYRVPHALGGDYWVYQRWARIASENCDTLVIGDSAIWGPYVTRTETLPAYLNRLAGRQRYANVAVEGMHPAALAGLVEFYGAAYAGKRVVLQWNPLWLSDPRLDLRESEFDFNHPQLVPQFSPKIPCLKEDTSRRIGNSLERGVDFCDWTNHLQTAYFEAKSLPQWTMDHPRQNPLTAMTCRLPESQDRPEEGKAVSWEEKKMPRREFEWVDLETSIQWRSFRRIVEILEKRGCKVFVLLGPFNEPMLKELSLESYRKLRGAVESWLKGHGTDFWTAPPLPSAMYADASHPLANGYELLARQLSTQGFFK
ncbi:MAG TPA: hypothetical protein VEN81_05085 [Planctomycetota bacterium]|nr:hypothetical protein [Planctomycetota bacterium]